MNPPRNWRQQSSFRLSLVGVLVLTAASIAAIGAIENSYAP